MAALYILIFQVLILLTGNYGFFNLLTIALCVFLFDDAANPACTMSWTTTLCPSPNGCRPMLGGLMRKTHRS